MLVTAGELAQRNLDFSKSKIKLWYNKKVKLHEIKVGEKVLVLLPLHNHTLRARYCGLYLVSVKVNNVD